MKATIKSRPSVLKRKNDTLLQIRQNAADLGEVTVTEEQARELFGPIGYTPYFAVQTSLPYTDPGEIQLWQRENGFAKLTVQPWLEAKWDKTMKRRVIVNHGIPSGSIPRLAIAYLSTQAVLTGCREIDLGDTLSEWMRKIGYTPKWGRNATNDRFADQIWKLASCSISYYQEAYTDAGFERSLESVKLVKNIKEFWASLRSPEGQRGLWNAVLLLTQDAFEAFCQDAVPLNLLTLQRLKHSPLKIDVYTWLAPRLFRLRRPQEISYDGLAAQFGSQFDTLYAFARNFDGALIDVCREYTAAKVEFIQGGVRLYPSLPHVKPTKDTNDNLLTD